MLWPVFSRWVRLGLTVCCGLAGCGQDAPVNTDRVRAYAPVDALVVARGTGRIHAVHQAGVSPATTGRLQWRLPVGARVAAGEVLARLRPDPVEAAHAHAEAALATARDQARHTQAVLASARASLAQARDADGERQARVQLEQALATERAQMATLARAEQALAEAGQALARTVLRAPFAGIVSQVHGDIGDHVSPALPVVSLADADSLRVDAQFVAAHGSVRLHQPCLLTRVGPPAERLAGELLTLTSSPSAGDVRADARVPGNAGWPLGAAVEVACLSRAPAADEWRTRLIVPRDALRGEGARRLLWKVEQGRVRRLEVTVGAVHGAWVEVRGELRVGDPVVLAPPADLADGAPVRLRTPA